MKQQDFNKIVNDILLQVKPLRLREQIAKRFLELYNKVERSEKVARRALWERVYSSIYNNSDLPHDIEIVENEFKWCLEKAEVQIAEEEEQCTI